MYMSMTGRDRDGMALILVSGILTLLAVAVASLAGFARAGGLAAGARISAVQAGSAAESGLAYAAARLWEHPVECEVTPTRANAADDWTCRDAAISSESPALSKNPSYARGDVWIDTVLTPDGRFTAGTDSVDPAGDLEKDGRLDIYSGRLRGGASPFADRFSLRVVAPTGFVCINSGELGSPMGDHDMDGVLNDKDTNYSTDLDADGIPDWRDPDFRGNRHLVNLLNNLGVVLDLSDTHDAPYAPFPAYPQPHATDLMGTVRASNLGRIVVEHRPRGGYSSVAELEPFLNKADYDKAAPFLMTMGRVVPIPQAWDPVGNPIVGYEFHALVDFHRAPVGVLKAMLRNVTARGSTLSGEKFVRLQKTRTGIVACDEADRVAEALDTARKIQPIRTWKDLLTALHAAWVADPGLYDSDRFIEEVNASLGTSFDTVQGFLKEDLVLALLNPNYQCPDVLNGSAGSLEVERDPAALNRTRPVAIFKGALVANVMNTLPFCIAPGGGPLPPPPPPPGGGLGFEPEENAPAGLVQIRSIPSRMTTGCFLTPAYDSFCVESAGWLGGEGRDAVSGIVRMDLSLEREVALTGQQDFDPILGIGPNPSLWRFPGGDVFHDASVPIERKQVQSFPRFPLVSPDRTNYLPLATPIDPWFPAEEYGYPRTGQGGIQLSARQLPSGDETFAMPYNEDGIPDPVVNRYDPATADDNIFDPFHRSAFPVTFNVLGGGFARQNRLGPCGRRDENKRFSSAPGDPLTYFEKHECAWDSPPFSNAPLGPLDWIQEGTIMFWYPIAGAETPASAFTLRYDNGGSQTIQNVTYLGREYLCVSVNHVTGGVSLATYRPGPLQTLADPVGYAYPSTGTGMEGTGWRMAAITLQRSGALVNASVYLDGIPVGPSLPLRFCYNKPRVTSKMWLACFGGPVDDLIFLDKVLSPSEIRAKALESRFSRDGQYRSPRFRFDSNRFPGGAFVSRLSWDAFIPFITSGSFTFTVNGYDETDSLIGSSSSVSWNGAGPMSDVLRGLPKVHSFDVTVDITTNPSLEIDGVKILRDTPVLEELRVSYVPGKPRWSGYGVR